MKRTESRKRKIKRNKKQIKNKNNSFIIKDQLLQLYL